MEEERYFDGPYIPLYPTLVVCLVFFCMFMISNLRWEERERERDEAYVLLHEEIPRLHGKISSLKVKMMMREIELRQQYDDMQQVPPIWPEVLVAAKDK